MLLAEIEAVLIVNYKSDDDKDLFFVYSTVALTSLIRCLQIEFMTDLFSNLTLINTI